MKITFISDTHTKHYEIKLPKGDILIFSGDAMGSGFRNYELKEFIEWFANTPYKYKIYVGGNHDRYYENNPEVTNKWFDNVYDKGVRHLCNEMIEIDGLKIYGTPYQPYFCNWAFNVPDKNKLYNIYKQIPEGLDILVTHCPPYDILDKSHEPNFYFNRTGEEPLGSEELSKALLELNSKPKYHVFGHIHGDGGKIITQDQTTYINASICDENYDPINKIISLEIKK